jgi:hypothetical protein
MMEKIEFCPRCGRTYDAPVALQPIPRCGPPDCVKLQNAKFKPQKEGE